MAKQRSGQPVEGWIVWGRPLLTLGAILFGPLILLPTPLRGLAVNWMIVWVFVLLLVLWAVVMSALIGLAMSEPPGMLTWLEQRLRLWVARFAEAPALLWLHWARHAFRPEMARWCLDRAVQDGDAEALFQEGLIYLEGGFGAGGQGAAMIRLRRSAEQGHAEAAFRLAEGLRTGTGSPLPQGDEAIHWYLRSAARGYGPAAQWLAHAYETGDGVGVDDAKARQWYEMAARLRPFPEPSRNLLRHDAAPEDPLVRLSGGLFQRFEAVVEGLIAHRFGRLAVLLVACLLLLFALIAVGAFFWAGSSGLYNLPLFMLLPPVFMLVWQAYHLRKDRPRSGRDRLLEAAEGGDPEACYELGVAYRMGGPTRLRDSLTAALWFRKAAEAGHPLAMIALSDAYLGGHGVLRDPREAARWAEAARHESTSEPSLPIKPPR